MQASAEGMVHGSKLAQGSEEEHGEGNVDPEEIVMDDAVR